MNLKNIKRNKNEAGNALFYILIAVVLLASLSYAVSQGSRSTANALNDDRTQLLATEILSYADTIKNAVSTMRLRGTVISDLSFAHPDLNAAYGTLGDDPANEVFNTSGGRVLFNLPSADAFEATDREMSFTGYVYVTDVGTNCGAECSELIMMVYDLKEDVCRAINEKLGIASIPGPENTEVTNYYADGDFTDDFSISSAEFEGEYAGCFDNNLGESNYTFYQVLWAQ